jgi:hypothetical protein
MVEKVLIFSRHPKTELGSKRIKLVKKRHSKNTVLKFENIRFGEQDPALIQDQCLQYFKKKIEEGYFCYVILPPSLRKLLLANGISFGVISYPQKVKNGTKISIELYSPDTPKGKVAAQKVLPKNKHSAGYINTSGKRGVKKVNRSRTLSRVK